VPPSGNSAIVPRYVLRDPLRALRVTYGFISKNFVSDAAAARELFFSADLPEGELAAYMRELAACSRARLLDLKDVNQRVPLPHPSDPPPAFVLGGADDGVVDPPAVAELAAAYGVRPVLLEGLAHDVMLDTRWEAAAGALKAWLDALPSR
jgi:pimeloyl-ACP methyl ester carboxylesterase